MLAPSRIKSGSCSSSRKPLERVAHGWLGELELAARAGEIAFAVDGLQHNKQVKIDLAQMHGTNFTLFP